MAHVVTDVLAARVIKPPQALDIPLGMRSVFLAGSIEMGAAIDWQKDVEAGLADLRIMMLNPRRDDFDPHARQSKDNPYFRGQVDWELDGLERADLILMYFAPGTKAPISLYELGRFGDPKKMIVCCPDQNFWRKGNVDIVVERNRLPVAKDLAEMINMARARLEPRTTPQLEFEKFFALADEQLLYQP